VFTSLKHSSLFLKGGNLEDFQEYGVDSGSLCLVLFVHGSTGLSVFLYIYLHGIVTVF